MPQRNFGDVIRSSFRRR